MNGNTHIISNFYEWDENGFATAVKEPVVHAANKDETTIEHLPIYEEIKTRKNVLLLGNSLNDLDMIKGFAYENLLTIGFLNEHNEKKLEAFKEKYDIVITDDASMDFVNELMKGIN